jgi:hypothetical protein
VKGADAPLRDAVTVTLELEVTFPMLAVNDAEVEEAGTVTEVGMVRAGLLEDRATTAPPVGAALDSVTVHGVLALEARLEAAHCREERLTRAVRDNAADAEEPLREAVTVAL